ncbi:DUF3267 domain-containing protein [Corynebacterium sp. H130]|uniref:DUF3267 domain-containing protein n=1 Tax=Corynebacterium sp. H130 TaxID=3133444 RepID=UPI0030AC08C5
MTERLIEEWIPDVKTAGLMNVVGLVATIASIVGFASLYSAVNPGTHSFEISTRELGLLLGMLLFVFVFMVVHELIHGFALRTLGHKPKYGATMVGGVMPAFYCTSPGARLGKGAFVYVALLPGIVLAILPAVYIIAQLPLSGWLVVPAGVLLGGAVGDWFMTVKALRAPKGALVEDIRDGIRIWG